MLWVFAHLPGGFIACEAPPASLTFISDILQGIQSQCLFHSFLKCQHGGGGWSCLFLTDPHFFLPQILTKHLLCARHCSRNCARGHEQARPPTERMELT